MLTTQVICGICAQKFYTKRSFYASTFATAGQSENTLDSKEDNRTISVFPLEVITGMATQYKEVICPKHPDDKVSLGRLIPDLLLLDILDMHRIEENIELGRQLGGGGQAEVFEVFLPRYGQCAVKTFLRLREFNKKIEDYTLTQQKLVNPQSPISVDENNLQTMNIASTNNFCTWIEEMTLSALLSMRREAMILRRLNHPLIIKMLGIVVEPLQPFYIVLELANEGNLYDFMKRSEGEKRSKPDDYFYGLFVDHYLIYKLAWQTVIALEYLHKEHTIYLDLKGQNVLLFSTNPADHIILKLSDFGISCQTDPQGSVGACGTKGYQAPELLKKLIYDEKVDIYAFAMLIYVLFTARHPFFDANFLYIDEYVRRGQRPLLKDAAVKPNFASLEGIMHSCWIPKAEERPPASYIRKKMETLSFYLLRHVIDFENATSSLTPEGNRSNMLNKGLQREMHPLLLHIPQTDCVCVVAWEDERYQCTVVNPSSGEWTKKILEVKDRIALATSAINLLFFHCNKDMLVDSNVGESVLIFSSGERHISSVSAVNYLGTLKSDLINDTYATANCACPSQLEPPQYQYFVGCANGVVARYTLFFNHKGKPAWNDIRIMKQADSMTVTAMLTCKLDAESGVTLLIATGSTIILLNTLNDTILRSIPTPFDQPINYMQFFNTTIWIGSASLPSLAKISLERDEADLYLPDLKQVQNLSGMQLVDDNLWCAFGSTTLVLNQTGKIIGELELPRISSSSSRNEFVESIVFASGAITALTHTNGSKKRSIGRRLIIWETPSRERVEQIKLDWLRWKDY